MDLTTLTRGKGDKFKKMTNTGESFAGMRLRTARSLRLDFNFHRVLEAGGLESPTVINMQLIGPSEPESCALGVINCHC